MDTSSIPKEIDDNINGIIDKTRRLTIMDCIELLQKENDRNIAEQKWFEVIITGKNIAVLIDLLTVQKD